MEISLRRGIVPGISAPAPGFPAPHKAFVAISSPTRHNVTGHCVPYVESLSYHLRKPLRYMCATK